MLLTTFNVNGFLVSLPETSLATNVTLYEPSCDKSKYPSIVLSGILSWLSPHQKSSKNPKSEPANIYFVPGTVARGAVVSIILKVIIR